MRLIDATALSYKIKDEWFPGYPREIFLDYIEEMPTIEPKHGKWIFRSIESPYRWECNKCGDKVRARYNFCPNCGAKMDADDWEEPEINPCRGCDDYDGRGGCKSNGGCAEEKLNELDENWYTELDDPKIAERSEE